VERIKIILLCLVFANVSLLAQSSQWKTKTADNGKITVSYKISERTDENGKKAPLIEDSAVAIESLSLQRCISLMKDVANHKEFTGDCISKKVKTISDSEWVVYYFSKNPWPIENSECVAKMTFSQDAAGKTAIFKFSAAPAEMTKGDVKRVSYMDQTYAFKDLGDGRVEMTATGKSSPAVKVPLLFITSSFPEAPAKTIRKFINFAKAAS